MPRRAAALLIAVATIAAGIGCGGDDDDAAPGSESGADDGEQAAAGDDAGLAGLEIVDDGDPALPVTVVDSTGTEVTIESADRIVAANGDLTETVFALGLGGNVVARDISATYPAEAAALPSIGYQRSLPSEPIAALDPTVVLANTLAGPPETIDELRAVGLPVVVMEYEDSVDGPGDKIRATGAVLGVPDQAETLAATVDQEIADAIDLAAGAESDPKVAAFYLRGEGVQMLFGPGSGMAVLLDNLGVTDVGAELGVNDAEQVDIEALLVAEPEAFVVTTSGLESVGGIDGLLALHDGALARTPAGEERRIYAYEDQYLLGYGPRTGAVMAELALDLHPELEETP